jgi:acyl carrier protein
MISDRLKAVLLRELKLDDFAFDDATTANQVPGWDSLSHVRVITAVETEYGIRFRPLEIVRLRSVGDLQAAIERKLVS